jgi:hypothetical protein
VGVGRAPPGEVTPEAAADSLLAVSRGTGSHGGATSPPHRARGRLEADARGGGGAVLLTVLVRAAPPRRSPRAIGSPHPQGCAAVAPPRRSPVRLEAGSGRARKKKSPEMWVAGEISTGSPLIWMGWWDWEGGTRKAGARRRGGKGRRRRLEVADAEAGRP